LAEQQAAATIGEGDGTSESCAFIIALAFARAFFSLARAPPNPPITKERARAASARSSTLGAPIHHSD
jgi:hypothetical protein